jgi:hypothetical protein
METRAGLPKKGLTDWQILGHGTAKSSVLDVGPARSPTGASGDGHIFGAWLVLRVERGLRAKRREDESRTKEAWGVAHENLVCEEI